MMPALPPHTPRTAGQQIGQLARMFGESESQEPKDAARAAWSEFHRAMTHASTEAADAGLRADSLSPIGRMFTAGWRYAEVWERRVRALEKLLRDVLASDAATATQREALVRALHGRTSPGRDPKLLTDCETALLANYRALAAPDRQAMRTLMARLAAPRGGAMRPARRRKPRSPAA